MEYQAKGFDEMSRRKPSNENVPCANCGLPLGKGRFGSAKYCLRKPCRDEVNKRNNKNSNERLRRLWNGTGY